MPQKHPKYRRAQGFCAKCGTVALLYPDPKAPRFGRGYEKTYTRPEDARFCLPCVRLKEAGIKRIEAYRERESLDARRNYEKRRLEKKFNPKLDDSRGKYGKKLKKYDL